VSCGQPKTEVDLIASREDVPSLQALIVPSSCSKDATLSTRDRIVGDKVKEEIEAGECEEK